MNFTQEYNYSKHYGNSQVPAHLLDSVYDGEAPTFFQAAVGDSTITERENAA